jgi:thiamine transport system substrate-binding protein
MGAGPAIKQAFEAECDCTLEWVGVQDGVAILTRLKLEGETRAPTSCWGWTRT